MAAAASFLFYFCVSPKTFWHSDDLINIHLATMISIFTQITPVWGETLKVKISTYQYKSLWIYWYTMYIIHWYHYLPSAQADPLGFEEAKPEQERAAKRKASPFRERNSCWYSAAILSPKIKDKALTIWLADVTHLASYHIRVFWYACCLYFEESASEHLSI